MVRFLLLFLFVFGLSFPAQAQDYNTLLDIPPGTTLINFSVTERVEVDQDLLTANLRYETTNKNSRALQDEINKLMTKAVAAAKKVDSVKVSTQSYHVYQYDPDPRNAHDELEWRGSQGLQIKGKKADDLLELVGELQDMGLSMNGLGYSVSPELMEDTHNDMLEAALDKLKVKAERTAKALDKSKADLLNVNVDIGGGHRSPPMMARMEMATMDMSAAKMSAPVASPGQSDITLTVSAQALIK